MDGIYRVKGGDERSVTLEGRDGIAYLILLVMRVRPCICHPEVNR